MTIYRYFLLFIFYSVLGWIIEVITEYVHSKKFVNRGFLVGPYCPIYGYAAVLIVVLTRNYLKSPFVVFLISMFTAAVIEYLTSYGMEKIFKARWWDYENEKFNINGRICLETMIPFGLSGIILVYLINPLVENVLLMTPNKVSIIIAILIFIIFFGDTVLSIAIVSGFKNYHFSTEKDSTKEITKLIKEKLSSKSFFNKRIFKAFPKIEFVGLKKIKDKIEGRKNLKK